VQRVWAAQRPLTISRSLALALAPALALALALALAPSQLADPIASIIISGLVLLSVAPLLGATVGPLLSRVPEGMEDRVRRAKFAIEKHPDVARVEQLHVWKMRGDHVVGTLHVLLRGGAGAEVDEQRVLRRVKEEMARAGITQLCAQVERDDAVALGAAAMAAAASAAAAEDAAGGI
jgi:Co/Zn/Cd efflux system component